MKRFFGMMPSAEIYVEKRYRDRDGHNITIQSGLNGWTIIYADQSSEFRDITTTTDENFKEAYNRAVDKLGTLVEV